MENREDLPKKAETVNYNAENPPAEPVNEPADGENPETPETPDTVSTETVKTEPPKSAPTPPKKYNEKVAKAVRTSVNVLTTAVVALVVIFAILIVGVRFFGVQLYIILSGSMEPEYHTGGLIYVVEVDPDDLKVGDDITFKLSNGTPATHRIIEILPHPDDPTPENPSLPCVYRTQGIANEHPDANYVEQRNIIGKPIFSLPYLGYVVDFIQSPKGIYSCAIGAIALIILMILPDVLFPKPEEPKSKKKKKKGTDEAPSEPSEPSTSATPAENGTVPPAEAPATPSDEPKNDSTNDSTNE